MPVRFRPRFKILMLVYKAMNGIGSQYLRDLISPYCPIRSIRSKSKNLLQVQSSQTVTYRTRIFGVAAVTLWNSLPLDVRDAENLETFKRLLKTNFFRAAFSTEHGTAIDC